jgi:drug/metabolite transporter (DMT)-like permease
MNRSTLPSILAALAAAVLFGASAPLAKILLGGIDPVPLAALLYLGSGASAVLLDLVVSLTGPETRRETGLSKNDLPWLTGAILTGGVAAPILLMLGLQYTPAATAALLLNFEMVATTLIALLVFKEAVGRRAWWAVGLVTVASVVLSWNSTAGWGFSPGALAILAACTLWGIDNNLTGNISAHNPLRIVLFKGLGAGLCSTLIALMVGQRFPAPSSLLLALLLGALSYGLSITLFILAMRGLGAARTSTLFGSAPFAGALIAFALLREPFTLAFLPALLLMATGGWLLLSENHVHAHIHQAFVHDHRHNHRDDHHRHTHSELAVRAGEEHAHPHHHEPVEHSHTHAPDLHHRHAH